MIYFMQPTDGGPVKIGTSGNVEVRHRQLETHYGKPLAILATMPGGPDEEAEIHERFAHLRFDGSREGGRKPEQFRPAAELMAFIGLPLLVSPNPDAVEVIEPTPGSRETILSLKGSPEWSVWLGDLSSKFRTTKAGIIDRALAEFAERNGYREPPDR